MSAAPASVGVRHGRLTRAVTIARRDRSRGDAIEDSDGPESIAVAPLASTTSAIVSSAWHAGWATHQRNLMLARIHHRASNLVSAEPVL